MKKKYIVFGIIFLQLAFLAGMIILQQAKLINATHVLLETVPYDPLSIFRGHYASLRYKISSLPLSLLKDVDAKKLKGGQELFVLLKKQGEFWDAQAIYAKQPRKDNNVYIRGRLQKYYRWSSRRPKIIELEYGIESFFLSQESAQTVDRRNTRQERDRHREGLIKNLNEETRRIYNASLSGWWYEKFEKELKVLVKEEIITQEAKDKINNKYTEAFKKIDAIKDTPASQDKIVVVEVAVDSEHRGHLIRLLIDGKEYR